MGRVFSERLSPSQLTTLPSALQICITFLNTHLVHLITPVSKMAGVSDARTAASPGWPSRWLADLGLGDHCTVSTVACPVSPSLYYLPHIQLWGAVSNGWPCLGILETEPLAGLYFNWSKRLATKPGSPVPETGLLEKKTAWIQRTRGTFHQGRVLAWGQPRRRLSHMGGSQGHSVVYTLGLSRSVPQGLGGSWHFRQLGGNTGPRALLLLLVKTPLPHPAS